MIEAARCLYQQHHDVQYGQVMLLAVQADGSNIDGSYPEFDTGAERMIHSAHGVVVTTKTDVQVQLRVTADAQLVPRGYGPVGFADIEIPFGKIELGNEITADIGQVSVRAGRYRVTVFTDALESASVMSVCFLLEPLQ